MRGPILIVIFTILIILTLKEPMVGVLLWAWLSFMNPHKLTWGSTHYFCFAEITAIALFLSTAIHLNKVRLPNLTPTLIFLLFFILWQSVTTYYATTPDAAFYQWSRSIKIYIMAFMTLILIKDEKDLLSLIIVIALSLGFFGVRGGIFTILTAGQGELHGPPNSFFTDNNTLGLALLMSLPLLFIVKRYAPWPNKIKIVLDAIIILTIIAIIGTRSRGTFIGLASMLVCYILLSKKKIRNSILILVIAVSIFPFLPDSWVNRMQTIENYHVDRSAMGRINSWRFAYNLAKDRPFLGGGYGAFNRKNFEKYAPNPDILFDAHSIYFEVLGEQGFVGLFLFLATGVFTFITIAKIRRRAGKIANKKIYSDIATAAGLSLIAYGTSGAFLGLAYFDLPYHIIVVVEKANILLNENEPNH